MTNHNTIPTHHTLNGDVHRGYNYIHDHPAPFVLGTTALLALGIGTSLAAENDKNYTCIPGDEVVTAQSGDSLWSLSEQIAPTISPEVTIHHLLAANPTLGEPGHVLQPGETLSLPICGDDIPQH